jgi:hypothetical protein
MPSWKRPEAGVAVLSRGQSVVRFAPRSDSEMKWRGTGHPQGVLDIFRTEGDRPWLNPWGGRLSSRPSDAEVAFRLISPWPADGLPGHRRSRAHALMLGEKGIIPAEEAASLSGALDALEDVLPFRKARLSDLGPAIRRTSIPG